MKKLSIIFLTGLGLFIGSISFALYMSKNYKASQPKVIQASELENLTELQKCDAFFDFLEWSRHQVFCPDINACHEPCWQYYEENIRQCLALRGEEVTLEKIQVYMDYLPDPEFFVESRKHCYGWAKTGQELESCLAGYRSICP